LTPEPTLDGAPELLTRKEVVFHFRRDRTTVWRWQSEGAPFIDGRIKLTELVWWLEQRDAAKRLGIAPKVFFAKPRKVREQLLKVALVDATLCNISAVDGKARNRRRSGSC